MAGRHVYVSPEERAHAVALFRETPSIRKVADILGWGDHITRRILIEEKAYDARLMINGRNLEDSIALRKNIQRMWRLGTSINAICKEFNTGESVVMRVTKNIPRPEGPRYVRRVTTTIPAVDDHDKLCWLAGVMDTAVNMGIDTKDRPYLRMVAEASFAHLVHSTAGCGVLVHPKERSQKSVRYEWTVDAMSDALELIRRTEPYLRAQGPLARRILSKYANVLAMIDKKEKERAAAHDHVAHDDAVTGGGGDTVAGEERPALPPHPRMAPVALAHR